MAAYACLTGKSESGDTQRSGRERRVQGETIAMSYAFLPGMRYRMPTHFGPAPGPRQRPDGGRYDCVGNPGQTILHAAFRVDIGSLEKLLPPNFEPLRGELGFSFNYLTNVEWLAGRGYNTFGVSVPARFRGKGDPVEGDLLLVLWENMADPIVTGREELGFSKVYCELPPFELIDGRATAEACWDGHRFATFELRGLGADPSSWAAPAVSQGLLHYKYLPRTGAPGVADAEYAVLTPASGGNFVARRTLAASDARCHFRTSTFEELPTLFHIVNTLAGIDLGECVAAEMVEGLGAKDLSDQHILT